MNNKTFEGKSILICGASGFIGSNIAKKLSQLGADVTGTYLTHVPDNNNITYIKADLTDREVVNELVKGKDFVFQCAANSNGIASMKNDPAAHVTVDTIMNTIIIESCAKLNVGQYVFLSSPMLYPDSDERMSEDVDLGQPVHPSYMGIGDMKRFAESLCNFYNKKYSLKVTVVRPSNVYGPGDKFHPRFSHVLPALIRRVMEKENPLIVWGTGNEIRDFIYIDDCVDGILKATEKIKEYNPINIASGEDTSIRELAIRISLATHIYPVIQFDPTKPTAIPIRKLSIKKAETILDFKSTTTLDIGITKTIEWYKEQL